MPTVTGGPKNSWNRWIVADDNVMMLIKW
jgi:hypothetical protein